MALLFVLLADGRLERFFLLYAPGAALAGTPKDPKLAAAIKKASAGQQLNPEEQKLVTSAAMMQAESRLRRAMRRLNESEVQQAQVVLAAQDMVDKMQGMLEDVSELQFKELPALRCATMLVISLIPTAFQSLSVNA